MKVMNKCDEIIIFIICLIVVLVNFQLFEPHGNQIFYLHIPSILNGEVWRLFTHPFAHMSFYHLATDFVVFLVLFREMKANSKIPIYKIILFCWVVSSLAAVISLPIYGLTTFGGLSGINYGLLIYFCLHQALANENIIIFRSGCFLICNLLILKQILECCFRLSLFQDVHYGYVGTPIIESHSGGMIAGLIAMFIQTKIGGKDYFQKDRTRIDLVLRKSA
jgi:rhomboid family GlyGly-CTERM serine protease